MLGFRVLGAGVATQVIAGLSAALSAYIFLPGRSYEEMGLVFAIFGGIVIIPAVLVVEGLIIFFQSRLDLPSLALQVTGSTIAGIGLSYLIGTDFGNADPVMTRFVLLLGVIAGFAVGLAWFLIVTLPTHKSKRTSKN